MKTGKSAALCNTLPSQQHAPGVLHLIIQIPLFSIQKKKDTGWCPFSFV